MFVVPTTIVAPSTLTWILTSPYFGVDLTTVTAVALTLFRKDGTSASYVGSIVAATPGELTAQYTFAGGEITTTGVYYWAVSLAVSGGAIPVNATAMLVTPPNGLAPKLEESAWLASTAGVPGNAARSTWIHVTPSMSPYPALPFAPWFAADTTTGAVDIELWPARDGDNVFANLVAGAGAFTLTPSAGQGSPINVGGAGGFGRWKFFAALNEWLAW